ncbi:hypothetical protein BN12_1220003 [Nostocoides japonicum T1-X7]|uniref:Uncharacterized protein n=1 Tax=Nostocoides japonicum T1-X7 TaxID=1194083 RepID=A0A077LWI2_9MICO|nr:hypothetical protein BN12_1220003 [Tetrasphaera japonica T1-X7]
MTTVPTGSKEHPPWRKEQAATDGRPAEVRRVTAVAGLRGRGRDPGRLRSRGRAETVRRDSRSEVGPDWPRGVHDCPSRASPRV